MTSEQLELISADPRVMHGQAVIACTWVPVSVILDGLAARDDGRADHCRIPDDHRGRKLGVSSRSQAVARSRELSLLEG